MNTSEAMHRVEELIVRESIDCSDCGQSVDLSGADTEMEVVETIAHHHASHARS